MLRRNTAFLIIAHLFLLSACATSKVYRLGDPESKLKVLYQPPVPPYPAEARAARIQGTVIVEVVISPEGIPTKANAVKGPEPLREVAQDYAMKWRFEPMIKDGKAVWAKFKLVMPFVLEKTEIKLPKING